MKLLNQISDWFVKKHLDQTSNDFERRKVLMVFRLSFYFMLCYIVYVLALFGADSTPEVTEVQSNFTFEIIISIIILSILKFSRTFKPAAIAFTLYNFTILAIYIHIMGDMVTVDTAAWFILLTLYANFTLGKNWGLGLLAGAMAILVGFTVYGQLTQNFFDPGFYESTGMFLVRLINQCMTFVFTFYIIREYFNTYNRETIISQKVGQSLEIAVEGADLVLWDWLIAENQVLFNAKITDLLGYKASDLESNHEFWESLIHPDDFDASREKLREYMEGDSLEYENEYRVKSISGEYKWLLLRGKVVERNEAGEAQRFSGTYLDITARKEAEFDLVRAKEEADKARRIAEEASKAKTQFLSTMSHEIRTPMNGIIGAMNLLMESDPREDQDENLNILKFSSSHLQTLVNDILDFSKIDAGRIEFQQLPFDLNEMLGNISQALRVKAEHKGIQLDMVTDNKLPYQLVGDAGRLNQILMNLTDNGVKFTHKGKVRLAITRERETDKEVRLRFSIIDTGIGIEKNRIDSMFQSFTQADSENDREFGGTGLGLSIARKLVELQGGKIDVESEVGRGSTFSFALTFKLGKPITTAADPSAEVSDVQSLKGKRILIVEDNMINQRVAKKFLIKWEAEVDVAENGQIGVDKVVEHHYDLILMDLQMPVMDGFVATEEIRKMTDPQKAKTPIIALTASALLDVKDQVTGSGMDDFSSKPFNPDELYEKITRLIQKNQPVTPAAPAAEEKPSLKGIKVLIVEDNMINQRVAKKFLVKWEAEVDVAENGQIALDKMEEITYDLILMDLQMPVMDGFVATREIRKLADPEKAHTPIIALTASALLDVKDQLDDVGMDDFSSKPFNPQELYSKIQKALSGEKPADEEPSLKGMRVLIVEDNMINQRVAKQFLVKWEAEVEVADNGQIALEKMEEQVFDLVLMDLQMPVMDGFVATREIRGLADLKKANTPIIALTASALLDVKDQLEDVGMDDFSSKPFNPAELYGKILNATKERVTV